MKKYFIDAFKITNNNIILATPLILFILFLTLYIGIMGASSSGTLVFFIVLVTYFLMWAAFLSGWFYIIRKAILLNYEEISKEEKIKKSYSLIKKMVKGVGKNFFSILGMMLMSFIFFILLILLTHYIGIHLIGGINISKQDLYVALNSNSKEALESLINTLPMEELVKIVKWIYFCLFSFCIFAFFQIYWSPTIIKGEKNVFKALYTALKFLRKNFLITMLLFIVLVLVQVIVTVMSSLISVNSTLLTFLLLLIDFYIKVYSVVMVFLIYEKYEKKDNSDSGSDGIGQDVICDKSCKED